MSSQGSRANPHQTHAVKQTAWMGRASPRTTHKRSRADATKAPLSLKRKPLGNEIEDDSGDDARIATSMCDELQKHMMRIPAEICQTIMDIVFEEAFGPRTVRPHKDPSIMNVFLALDKELYRKFHQQYWTKNTWIVSKGPLNDTMRFMTEKPYNDATTEFSLQTPNKAALRIRCAELSFSIADTPNPSESQQIAEQSLAPYLTSTFLYPSNALASRENQPSLSAQRDIARPERTQRYDEIQQQLIQTWQDKFDRIAMLNLQHLTLDFTEAYDPSGQYLGVRLVPRLIPFAYGIPGDFKILAPNSWTEQQIREAFLHLNFG